MSKTRAQIVEALRRCAMACELTVCEGCPYLDECVSGDGFDLYRDAADMIEKLFRQKKKAYRIAAGCRKALAAASTVRAARPYAALDEAYTMLIAASSAKFAGLVRQEISAERNAYDSEVEASRVYAAISLLCLGFTQAQTLETLAYGLEDSSIIGAKAERAYETMGV